MSLECVCTIVLRSDGTILCASRRHEPEQWSLPGGKIEPNESPVAAAVRELKEETSVELPESVLIQLGEGEDEHGNNTTAFFAQVTGDDIQAEQTELGIFVDWKPSTVLTDPKTSPFAGYNIGILQVLAEYFEELTFVK